MGVCILSGGASSVPMSQLPRRVMGDIRLLIATPVALLIALLFIAGASWGMSVFPREEVRPVVAETPAITANQTSEFERWWDVQPKRANFPFNNDAAQGVGVQFAYCHCPH